MSLTKFTTNELLQQLSTGALTAGSLVQEALQRIDAVDPGIQAFLHVDRDRALEAAERIDNRRRSGEPLGPLAGLPIAIKDNLCEQGTKTTCASRMLENFVSPYDAHVIERMRAADAILIGRTNLDEFAMGSSCETSAFQTTRNPWDSSRTPGGSSGGSAAAVAAGMTPLAVGSDTGGSIRQPAAFCGCVGLKPTYGRISRYGLVAFASSLDQIGPFAKDVAGAALLLETLAGHDVRDTTSIDAPVPSYFATVEQPLTGLRIGIAREHFTEGLDPEVEQAVQEAIRVYQSLGAETVDVRLPHSKYAVAVYYIVAPSEASSNLARYDGVHYGHRAEQFENMIDMFATTRGEAFGDEVKRRIMLGTYALSAGYYEAYYNQALKVRRLIRQDFDAAFARCDIIASPVTPTPAFKLGEMIQDPLAMYLNDIYTLSANLSGIPAISLPCGFHSQGLPIGLQLLGPTMQEDRLLRAARMYERETDWHKREPLPIAKDAP